MSREQAILECCRQLLSNPCLSLEELEKLKCSVSSKHHLSEVIKNSELLSALPKKQKTRFIKLLKTSLVRSASGVCVIAVMTKPAACPGECIYCPSSSNAPKSYTGREPAALRAAQNNFSAFKQVSHRLRQLQGIGHFPSKCELVVMGGTFNSLPKHYQTNFVKQAFDAFNKKPSKSLRQAKELNERALHRVVGVTFETRPDWISPLQVSKLLDYGATRIELGVQSLDDRVLQKVRRRHGVKEVIEATKLCKDSFLKVGFHYMPGLFADKKKDLQMFKKLFLDQNFKPDFLKIYPALVIPATELHSLWEKKIFSPYSSEEAAEVIAEFKRFIPPYCRIMRINRDIPSQLIAAGVKKSNLRELVARKAREKNIACKCIRCREVGFRMLKEGIQVDWSAVELRELTYNASQGKEVFLSFEDTTNDALLAFIRLRKPSETALLPEASNSPGVRELRVFGEQLRVGEKNAGAVQHKSLGKKLLEESEEIAGSKFGVKKLLVLSGVGARPYYRKQGFKLRGNYMVKTIG